MLLFLALLMGVNAMAQGATGAPNIVVILADDMHWHHPGFNGGPAETPNLDRLASGGSSLTQFYVHSVCSPTRAAFLTGRYPFRNGMEERSHGNDVAGMLTDERTLAEGLREAGYYTAIIGKWHLGNWHKRHLPMQRGFDYQYGLYGALIGYWDKCRERYYDWHRNEQTLREEGYSTTLIGQEFAKVVKAHDFKKPLFAYVPFNAVHGPDEAPVDLLEKYRALVAKRPGEGDFEAKKYAMLDAMDQSIGKMLGTLEAKGVLENTLIVFFNDNGGRKSNPPYRGGKGENTEGGVRVPCILHWPGNVPAKQKVDGMMHVVDLYPTLLGIGGGSLDQSLPIDGIDMWDTITAGKPSERSEVVYSVPGWEKADTGPIAIRKGDYKLLGEALFNIEQDPSEETDIAGAHPEIYQALHQRLLELASERRIPETHTNISKTIDEPLLVFGEEENANPPPWLEPYVKGLPPTKRELQRAQNRKKQDSK
ncbi:arylsulfatase B [Pelagicoccus mobilis]|nr:arylsulfatase [Pelagicoccus mobilis]